MQRSREGEGGWVGRGQMVVVICEAGAGSPRPYGGLGWQVGLGRGVVGARAVALEAEEGVEGEAELAADVGVVVDVEAGLGVIGEGGGVAGGTGVFDAFVAEVGAATVDLVVGHGEGALAVAGGVFVEGVEGLAQGGGVALEDGDSVGAALVVGEGALLGLGDGAAFGAGGSARRERKRGCTDACRCSPPEAAPVYGAGRGPNHRDAVPLG
ncbi:MAG TPA: hypothetical protein PLB78_09740 [Anaerolineae bacterium]|nr:hypothetical protein [Anaerolineae bacterium]